MRVPGDQQHEDSTFAVVADGERITVSRTSGPDVPWSLVLTPGVAVTEVAGGDLAPDGADGPTITASGDSVSLRLPG